MKCPLNGVDRQSDCTNANCMYNLHGGCQYANVQALQEAKDDQGIANLYGVSVSELRSQAKLIKAALIASKFFEFITGRNIEDGREVDFRNVNESADQYMAWNKTACDWIDVVEALRVIHHNL